MQLSWGARSSRPLPSASRRRAGHNHLVTPFSEWILPPRLFGETPNRATETVALPFSDCMVPAQAVSTGLRRLGWHSSTGNFKSRRERHAICVKLTLLQAAGE